MLRSMNKRSIKCGACGLALMATIEAIAAHVVECGNDPCARRLTQIRLPDSESDLRAPKPEQSAIIDTSRSSALPVDNAELREDGGYELREDGGYELREGD